MKYTENDFNFKIHREKLVAIELNTERVKKFWDWYSKFHKHTNLKYKDLLGTYHLDSCTKDFRGNGSPTYKKVLDDGTESYLYKAKIGPHWQVMMSKQILHK